MLKDLIASILEVIRTLDGRIFNTTTGLYEPATTTSLAAASTAQTETIRAVVGALPTPIPLGTLGSVTATAVDLAATKVTTALRAYIAATTK